MYGNHVLTGVSAVNNEVLSGTDAVISCKITGITEAITVKWINSDNDDVTTVTDASLKYTVDIGTFNEVTFSQTTTLTVKAAENTEDRIISCQITSTEWNKSDDSTDVELNVFGRSQ